MKIYIVRHGQTDYNLNNILQGQKDVPLNQNGKNQAIETAKKLSDINFDFIYASPLKRTMETCLEINKYHNKNIIYDNRLFERGFGDLEGLHGSKINMSQYWDTNLNLSNDNIESINDFLNRVKCFYDELYTKHKNEDINILIITHNGVHIASNYYFNGMPQSNNLLTLCLNTCEYKVYDKAKNEI